MEFRTLVIGLAAFLLSAVALTLLGFGGAAGNANGLLFWVLLVVLAVALGLIWRRSDDEDIVRLSRRTRDRDRG